MFRFSLLSLFLLLAVSLTLTTSTIASPIAQAQPSVYGVDAKGFKHVKAATNKLNIVLTNDDSWAAANVRATYYALRRAGHKVQMVAPAINESGTGGTVVLPTSDLTGPARYDSVPAGSPYFGRNASDSGLAYFNATPAATVFWALDQVKPFKGDIDLFVAGPNEGTNLGPFLYTLSGTIGASYAAVGRGYPAMAFSASSVARNYTSLDLDSTKDEAVILATATANFVTRWADTIGKYHKSKKAALLPSGVGINVNFSPINSSLCSDLKPTFKHTRLTGGANTDKLVLNDANLPTYALTSPKKGVNTCNVGDCDLQGETEYVGEGNCKASVSLYSIGYDAPVDKIKGSSKALKEVVEKLNK